MPQPIDQTLDNAATDLEVETIAQLRHARFRTPQDFPAHRHNLLAFLFEAHHRYPQYFPVIRRNLVRQLRENYDRDPQEVLHRLFTVFDMRPNAMMFEKEAEKMKPSKSDINWVIMDYLVSEGYPAAAEKFAQETDLCAPSDIEGIRSRVRIRTAIYKGDISEAVGLINEVDAEILDTNALLHFRLLQLQLIEIIRGIIAQSGAPTATDFLPAIKFATEQLSPRAPTDPEYQRALERTMALMIYPPEKMAPEFKELLDVKLREKVATEVNQVILESRGERREAKIRQLVRSRAWAESSARAAKVDLPPRIPIGLDLGDEMTGVERIGNGHSNGEAMVT